jgi:hypothetical protein
MESIGTIRPYFDQRADDSSLQAKEALAYRVTKLSAFLGWYRVLRAHCEWPVFQAIQYALWLTR